MWRFWTREKGLYQIKKRFPFSLQVSPQKKRRKIRLKIKISP
jgi:hypothetical protein